MSEMTYTLTVALKDKPLAWLHGEIKTPPLGKEARLEAWFLLRRLQRGELLSMPQSRPIQSIGARCHELRINDASGTWRIMYRIDKDAIVDSRYSPRRPGRRPRPLLRRAGSG